MISFGEEKYDGPVSQLSLEIKTVFENSMRYTDIQKSSAEMVAVELL